MLVTRRLSQPSKWTPTVSSSKRYSNKALTLAFLRRAVEIDKQNQAINQNLKKYERPKLPTKLHYLRNEQTDADVYLLGCNHGKDNAGSLAPEVVEMVQPEVTIVEENFFHFWEIRAQMFSYFKKSEVGQFGKKISFFSGLGKLMSLKENQDYIRKQKKPVRGREVLNGIEAAEKVGSSIVFADITDMAVRDRIQQELEEDERYKDRGLDPNMVCNCLAFGKGYETHILTLADKDFDVTKFGEDSKALVHGRDLLFIHHLRKSPAKKIVGIFGRQHLLGIVKYWENHEDRMKELQLTEEELHDPLNINPLKTAFDPLKFDHHILELYLGDAKPTMQEKTKEAKEQHQ